MYYFYNFIIILFIYLYIVYYIILYYIILYYIILYYIILYYIILYYIILYYIILYYIILYYFILFYYILFYFKIITYITNVNPSIRWTTIIFLYFIDNKSLVVWNSIYHNINETENWSGRTNPGTLLNCTWSSWKL